MSGAYRGGEPRLFELEVDTVTPPSPASTGMDAALWIQEQIKHGHHVVHLVAGGLFLTHPGCASDGPCEFLGRTSIREPRAGEYFYVAAVDKDGVIGPDHRASWSDVVTAEEEAS